MDWWGDFWGWVDESQVRANFVGGTLAAVLIAVLGFIVSRVPRWRTPIVRSLKRSVQWLASLRITTTTRVQRAINAGVKDKFPELSARVMKQFSDGESWREKAAGSGPQGGSE